MTTPKRVQPRPTRRRTPTPETRLPSRWDWLRADLWALAVPALRCVHRSHRWDLPCLRHRVYNGLCRTHGRCDTGCPQRGRRG